MDCGLSIIKILLTLQLAKKIKFIFKKLIKLKAIWQE